MAHIAQSADDGLPALVEAEKLAIAEANIKTANAHFAQMLGHLSDALVHLKTWRDELIAPNQQAIDHIRNQVKQNARREPGADG